MKAGRTRPAPFALSLSKGFSSGGAGKGAGFDKLSPYGCWGPRAISRTVGA